MPHYIQTKHKRQSLTLKHKLSCNKTAQDTRTIISLTQNDTD